MAEKFINLGVDEMTADVHLMDELAGYNDRQTVPEPDMQDLLYLVTCIAGESGEVANSAKKLIRDGFTEAEWNNLEKELIDIMIYIMKLAKNFKIDLRSVWDAKHAELYERNELGPASEWLQVKKEKEM